jgi:hypothetical protein
MDEDPDDFYERFRDQQIEKRDLQGKKGKELSPSETREQDEISERLGVQPGEGTPAFNIPCTCCRPPVLF